LTSVSQAGQKSKFKSCFGELQPVINKKAYVSNGKSRKKPTSYFDTLKRQSDINKSQRSNMSSLNFDGQQTQEQAAH